MPTLKTKKGAKERFKVTATGKVVGYKSGRRHLLSGKRAKLKRGLRRQRTLIEADAKQVRSMMPYA
jgi:large subunit ribosomal protein L35